MGDEPLEVELGSAPARRIDFLILGVDFLRRSIGMVEEAFSNLEQVLIAHANHTAEQKAFADAIRLDLETLHEEE